jgi:tetratricopeptide (TPR) repeat protein
MARVASCLQAQDYAGALNLLVSVRQHIQHNEVACNTLGFLYLRRGDRGEALAWFERAVARRDDYAEAWVGCGLALQGLKRLQEAMTAYTRALQLRPVDPVTWYNVAVVLDGLGACQEALGALDTALSQDPAYRAALALRCALLDRLGRSEVCLDAAEAFCRLAPNDGEALRCLGDARQRLGLLDEALAAYKQSIKLDPSSAAAWANRARALASLDRDDEAGASIRQALALAPDEPESLTLLGNLEKRAGRRSEAEAAYRRSVMLQPVRLCHTPGLQPTFRALFVLSPLVDNTPFEDLIRDAPFESRSLMLLEGLDYDVAQIAREFDVVVNLISDADCGHDVLALAAGFVAGLARPLVNPPQKVIGTDRASIARRLASIADLRMPLTQRVTRANLMARGLSAASGFDYPAILRLAGTHGGDRMERVESEAELRDVLAATTGYDFYLTQFHDYQSADGHFRKYRFIFVDGAILPYHLAIGDGWKVHHASTRMAETPWMQDEERAFLEAPQTVFNAKAFRVLQEIQQEIGLDYFGIDCALDREGQVVAFEINPTMLVHLNNALFPYKTAHVLVIKEAFARLLARKAGADHQAMGA